MAKVERVRQVLQSPFGAEELREQTEQGWKIVAIEWEREVPGTAEQAAAGSLVLRRGPVGCGRSS